MSAADVRCPRCAEPWHLDYLHEVAEDRGLMFPEVWADFTARGCQALEPGIPCRINARGHVVDVLTEALGHDVDGLASTLDEAEALGLI